jgi:hypothetical protein
MREEVVAHLDGMSREGAEAVDRAAQAMWKADGGDERMGWEPSIRVPECGGTGWLQLLARRSRNNRPAGLRRRR